MFFRRRILYRRKKNAQGYREHKEYARGVILARIAHFNADGNFLIRRVAIRNNTSRWGSCSKGGNLNFHYRTALLSPELCDYIVVHELCHLKEFNHSHRFWALVEQYAPEYRVLRAQLRLERL